VDFSAKLLIVYCVCIVAASLCGGSLPSLINLTHRRMQLTVSFVGGLMLGIAVLHMLPHSVAHMGSIDMAAWSMMAGLLTMFFLLRTFHFHQHEPIDTSSESAEPHGHHHQHHHGEHEHQHAGSHRLSWIGIAVGLALHTLIDGIALGASISADAAHTATTGLFGIGTFLAIVLHKPLDAVSITAVMAAGGWSAGWRTLINIGFALMCPLGAALFFLGVDQFAEHQHTFIGCGLAFSAGVFLCISLGDLLPEIEFHSHDRIPLSLLLLLGVALAYAIGFLEEDYVHEPRSNGAPAAEQTVILPDPTP